MNIANYVMTDAVEGGGISYWTEVRNVMRNADNEVVAFNEGPRQSDDWVAITEAAIRQAAEDIRDGKVDCSRDIASQFIGEDWDYDAIGVDCLIQHVAF